MLLPLAPIWFPSPFPHPLSLQPFNLIPLLRNCFSLILPVFSTYFSYFLLTPFFKRKTASSLPIAPILLYFSRIFPSASLQSFFLFPTLLHFTIQPQNPSPSYPFPLYTFSFSPIAFLLLDPITLTPFFLSATTVHSHPFVSLTP